jgi:integrase
MGWIEEVEVSPGRGQRRKNGRSTRYRGAYRDPAGSIRRKSFDRKGDAERWARRQEEDIARDEWQAPELRKITVAEYWPTFLGAKPRRPRTLERYDTLARRHVLPTFGHRVMSSVDADDVGRWLVDMTEAGVGDATRAAAFRLLRSIFRGALIARRVTWNPTTGIATPAMGREEMRFLDADDVGRLAEATPERYRALIYLLAYGGLRIGEAAALRREDLDLLHGRVRVEQALGVVGARVEVGDVKTKSSRRSVAIPRFLADMLDEHVKAFPSSSVEVTFRTTPTTTETRTMQLAFTSPTGQPVRPNNWRRRVFYPAAAAAGVGPLRVHDLRHSCVALLVAQGAHPLEIKARLGHSSIQTTLDTYGRLFRGLDERLAEGLEATFQGARTSEPPAPVSIERRARR